MRLLSSDWAICWRSGVVGAETMSVVSSANVKTVDFGTVLMMSLM